MVAHLLTKIMGDEKLVILTRNFLNESKSIDIDQEVIYAKLCRRKEKGYMRNREKVHV